MTKASLRTDYVFSLRIFLTSLTLGSTIAKLRIVKPQSEVLLPLSTFLQNNLTFWIHDTASFRSL
jgi:hypothetical protein